ncbi:MAG: cyclase family protein [Aeromicrobium sp.]
MTIEKGTDVTLHEDFDISRYPAEAEVMTWFDTLSNWGRWGADDQAGTLNLIQPEHRVAAAKLVTTGRTVSCSQVLAMSPMADGTADRHMVATGMGLKEDGRRPSGIGGRADTALESISMIFHGFFVTHIDSLAHLFWDGKMYNDQPANLVSDIAGAAVHDIQPASPRIVTRGVLLDVAAAKGVDTLPAGHNVTPEDLEEAEERQGVRVGEGDVILLRTGEGGRRERDGAAYNPIGAKSGYQAGCLPWFKERGVAAIGADVWNDASPFGMPTSTEMATQGTDAFSLSGYAELQMPVHTIGIVAMGLWLIDNCQLEELSAACAEHDRWEFLFSCSPLKMMGATGSPVNPIATF